MSAENKKQQLRSMLAGKSTAELEELLALEAADLDANQLNADFIATVLEVMAERESAQDEELTEKAWKDFQEYYSLRKQEETDKVEEAPRDHRRKTEHRQRSPKIARVIRIGVVAAVLTVLLGSTVFGRNFFRAVADWTAETFYFLTGQEQKVRSEEDVYRKQRLLVEKRTDIPAVPNWVPKGAAANDVPNDNIRTDRIIVRAAYTVGAREFSVQIIIHDTPPETYIGTYQKDATIEEEYSAGGICHYIVGNNETISAMWVNGCVEGYIQGELTVEELRQMIDSIYEE